MAENTNVDLNLLLVFRELIGELNATRAAARLGVSQAAVSGSLRKLRAAYGDPLFVRTQRGLRPTPKAVVLEPLIAQALGIIDGTLGHSASVGDYAHVVLIRLGLSDDFEMAYGLRIVELLKETMPEARLVFRQTNSLMAAQALNDREIDLAITSGGFGDGRLKHQSLASSDYLIVYDASQRPAGGPIAVDEYISRDHILVSYSGLTGVTDDVLAEHGLKRRVCASTSHFSALPFLLRGSPAVATIPGHAARAMCEIGPFAASPCPLPFPQYAYGLSWRFDAVRNPGVMRARDVIAEALAAPAPR